MREKGVAVTCALVDYPPVRPAFAYRLDSPDRSIVISGDTKRSDALIELARRADVLVHEAIWPAAVERLMTGLYNAEALKKSVLGHHTAAEAEVKTLVLSHLIPAEDPEATDEQWTNAVRRRGYKGPVIVGKDLLEISGPAPGSRKGTGPAAAAMVRRSSQKPRCVSFSPLRCSQTVSRHLPAAVPRTGEFPLTRITSGPSIWPSLSKIPPQSALRVYQRTMTSPLKILAITLVVGVTAWAADPFLGTWKLSPEKSKLMAGQRAEPSTMVCGLAEADYRFTSSNPSIPPAVYRLDGKTYEVPDNARFAKALGADEWSSGDFSANAIEATYFRAKKSVGTIGREVSSDGRTFSSTHEGNCPSGEKVAYVNAFEKK